jgi:phage anti-repressor protein
MNMHQQFPAITERAVAGQMVKTVDGREVHRFLEAKKDYTTWMKDRIKKYGFIENVDYVVISHSPILGSGNRGAKDEYFLTIGMGKELGMVDRNAKGRAIRKYFLSIEEQAAPQQLMTAAEILLQNAQALVNFERLQAEQQKAIAAIDARVEHVERTTSLQAKPQHCETKSEAKARMNDKYGLPTWVSDLVLTTFPYRPPVFAMVKNSNEHAQGSSFAVYQIIEVTKLFKRFVSECKPATATTATHPDIDRRFKLTRRE